MVLTLEQRKAFVDELKALIKRHRIGIVGTCETEGIYGELTIFPTDTPDPDNELMWENCLLVSEEQLNALL